MSVIKNYKITVRTLSPIHIGSGEKIDKKEYWYDRKNKKIGILDMQKMYRGLAEKGLLNKYESYMLFSDKPLFEWIGEQRITQEELMSWTRYRLGTKDAELDKRDRGIHLFCKDAYGRPYIPGSSLKGAFRTILLTAQILENPNKYMNQKEQLIEAVWNKTTGGKKEHIKRIENVAKTVEKTGFHTLNRRDERGTLQKLDDVISDCMAGIRVSDSNPLEQDKLMIGKKVDIPVRGRENEILIYRECIKPKTDITFEISIDTSIWKQNGNQVPYTIEQIRKSIDIAFEYYQTVFLNKFRERKVYQSGTFCLGGGVGYPSKTVTYPIIGEENWQTVNQILNITSKGRKDDTSGISPRVKKCTNYSGRTYDMGMCQWIKSEKI